MCLVLRLPRLAQEKRQEAILESIRLGTEVDIYGIMKRWR
jgi:hypothetical protein